MAARSVNRILEWLASPRAFHILLAVLLVGLSVQYSLKVMKPSRDGTYTRGAVSRWTDQIQALESGVDINKQFNYPNPPIMATILWPISELSDYHPLAGALTWYYLKVAMVYWCLIILFKRIAPVNTVFPPWACALATLLSVRPIMGDLSHGNVNIFIFFALMLGLVAFVDGKDFMAGVWIALATACKITPALFIVYFVYKRAWRTLAGAAVGLLLFFLVLPGLAWGWSRNIEMLSSWYDVMVKPFITGQFVTSEHNNQSLPGLVYRLFTHNPSFSTYVNDVYTPTEYHNLVDLGADTAKWLVKGGMLAFAALGIWLCTTKIEPKAGNESPRRGPGLWLEFALVAIGMLLFSERTWKHHCVPLLLANTVLCWSLACGGLSKGKRIAVIGLLALSQLLELSTSVGFIPDRAAKLAQVYGAYTWGFASLAAGLAVVRKDVPPKAPAVPVPFARAA